MTRWDEPENGNFNYDGALDEEQESHLLKKFRDYHEIEKNEVEKRRFLEASNKKEPGIWTKRFIIAAIIQVTIVASLTISLVAIQLIHFEINLMQLFIDSFEGSAKWFFFGYIMYMTLVVAMAVTAIFYNQIEVNMKKEFRGIKNILAGIHLLGMNVGGTLATMFMIWYGLNGSGITNLVSSGVVNLESQIEISGQFSGIIAIFAVFFAVGILAGSIAFITTYFQKTNEFFNLKTANSFGFIKKKTELDRL